MDADSFSKVTLALAALISALAGPVAIVMVARVSRQVGRVHDEVRPNNGMTNGETSDATLTKLIQMQPKAGRSVKDDAHMHDMAAADPGIAAEEERQL